METQEQAVPQSILDQPLLGMPFSEWLILVGVWALATVGLALVNRFLIWRFASLAERTHNTVDDYLAELFKRTKLFFLAAVGLYVATGFAEASELAEKYIGRIAFVLLLLQVVIWGNRLITLFITRYKERKLEEDAGAVTTMQAVGFVGRLLLFTTVLLLALDNFEVDITALVASLGIGGIAIALALQNVLGDLLASLSIVLDKPFVVGDFLVIDDYMGTVEHIGLKTTRLRSLSGEQLVFSNSDLLGSRIRNFKRMYERRVVFSIGVTYETPPEKLAAIPGMIRAIIEQQEFTRFDRSHFKSFDAYALTFETVYFVLVPDYNVYMDIQQAINLAVFERFAEEGITFAYPTQTLYVEPVQAEVISVQRAGATT